MNSLSGPVAAVDPATPVARLTLRDITRGLRIRQWAKNSLLFAGFVFAGRLRQPLATVESEAWRVLLAFVCFCGLAGATYLINDWRDIPLDRLHPLKRHRPLAAGRMSKTAALWLIGVMLLISLAAGAGVCLSQQPGWGFAPAAVGYLTLTLAYCFWLKHEVIVDVITVALGFVLRVAAGCLAIPVQISPWIIFCTFTVALFIALCKRRAELMEMREASADTRRVLTQYNLPMLDTLIAVAAGLTITAYSLYTFTASHGAALGSNYGDSPLLMITIPNVIYGIFRYLVLAHSSPVGGEPEQMMRDWRLMLNVVLWALLVVGLTLWQKM